MTRTGAAVAVGAVALYLLGVLLGYPALIALAIGGVTLLAAAVPAVLIRPRVALHRTVSPDRVTVGQAALGRIEVRNTSRWPSPAFTTIDQLGQQPIDLEVGPLAGAGRRMLHYPLPTNRRGRLRLGPLTVRRRDPLGLLSRAQRQAADQVVWVHPRVHAMRSLPIGVVLDYEGSTTRDVKPGTVTFSSLREYVPGDDPRRIHWRSTARTGTLIVREHVDTTEPTTTVLLDTRAAALDGDTFEHAVEVAASVLTAVEWTGRPASLHILGEAPALVRAAGAHSMLDRLAAAEQLGGDDPLWLLDTAERVPAGGTLVVITGAREPEVVTRLAEQRRRFNPVVIVTMLTPIDPGEPGTRRRPGMAVLAAHTGPDAAAAWNRMVGGETG